jgi:hypothetical protein
MTSGSCCHIANIADNLKTYPKILSEAPEKSGAISEFCDMLLAIQEALNEI